MSNPDGAQMRPVLELMGEFDGMSADRVADHLAAAGVTGDRRRTARCPLAIYLELRTGVPVFVGEARCYLRSDRRVSFVLPAAARQFVRGFDDGLYPNLVAASSHA